MARYSAEPVPAGWERLPSPCRVIDGAGREVEFCVRADTATGQVTRLVLDGWQEVYSTESRPPPLTLVPADEAADECVVVVQGGG